MKVNLEKPPENSQQKFPLSSRIIQKKDFARLLKGRDTRRINCGPLRLYSGPRLIEGFESGPRLGLIVAKRVLPRAVDRNLAKRKIRESFRRTRFQLGNKDVVVQLMRGKNLEQLSDHLDAAWSKLA